MAFQQCCTRYIATVMMGTTTFCFMFSADRKESESFERYRRNFPGSSSFCSQCCALIPVESIKRRYDIIISLQISHLLKYNLCSPRVPRVIMVLSWIFFVFYPLAVLDFVLIWWVFSYFSLSCLFSLLAVSVFVLFSFFFFFFPIIPNEYKPLTKKRGWANNGH